MADLNMTTVAQRLGWPAKKVRAQLSGRQRMSIDDVKSILTTCGWPPERQEALVRIGESTNTRSVLWLEPDEVCTSLIAYSRHLTRVVHVAPTMVPWPVQINDYAWNATLKTGGSPRLLDRWEIVRAVWTWRWKYEDEGMTGVIFLHENALKHLTDDGLMVRQLRELARMADFPGLSLRVIPTNAGMHAAIKGPFALLQFTQWTPLVHQECGNAAVITGTPDAIRDAEKVVHRLHHTALNEDRSREIIIGMWRAAYAATRPPSTSTHE